MRRADLRQVVVMSAALAIGCAGRRSEEDPLKNTKSLVVRGHVSLYENGAFAVPRTSISLIPPGPSALELAGQLMGVRARQSFETSLKRAAESVYIVSEGTKLTFRAAEGLSAGASDAAAEIRGSAREGSTLLVDRGSKLGKTIVGESWKLAKNVWASGPEKSAAVVEAGA
jgi:hypothetical protein